MAANHFWVSTVPRTGSMWTFNAIREIVTQSGRMALPVEVPQSDDDMMDIYLSSMERGGDPNFFFTYKVHQILSDKLLCSKIITTIRDPREIAISHMRFMKKDFAESMVVAKGLRRIAKIYSGFSKDYVLTLRYEDIVSKPAEVVETLMLFMELPTNVDIVEAVVAKLRPDAVKKLIEDTDASLKQKIANKEEIPADQIVYHSDDNYRAFNTATGFQTGHVSGMDKSEYRTKLTAEQVQQINDFYGDWLEQNGYSKEF